MGEVKYDIIIVGQGLAGSMLAWKLMDEGCSVLVIDDGYKSSSSKVAAGILNPITGKRLAKSWELERFLPVALNFYKNLEQRLGVSLFKEKNILRLFKNKGEIEKFNKIRIEDSYASYIEGPIGPDSYGDFVNDSLGSFKILQSGFLDTKAFLARLCQFFHAQGMLLQAEFDYEAVVNRNDGLDYKEYRAKHIVFCEGYKVCENPFFKDLKWNPAKGEILTLNIESPLPDYIINQGAWVLPFKEYEYKVGSNYDMDNINCVPSEGVRKRLLGQVDEMLNVEVKVVAHEAAVRPCTQNNRPIVGTHEDFKHIHVFNGFGSKGTLMIPEYAGEFAKRLSLCV